jgi:hypothetical protein
MYALGESGDKALPWAIPAKELQKLIGDNAEFCSWDASNKNVDELTDRWPFLFSHPFVSANPKKPIRG